jgi:Bacterial HORMA domain family 1
VSFTQSRSSSQTTTWARVKYVTRKVQADLFAILDTYRYYSEGYAIHTIMDLRVMLDEAIIDRVDFVWTKKGTNEVIDCLSYTVVRGDALPDQDTGDIRYRPELAAQVATFSVVIYRNQRWRDMPEASKRAIREQMNDPWEGDVEHYYGFGWWMTDRTYSKGGYGLERKRYVRA